MVDQTSSNLSDPLPINLRLALERTRGAYERTLMAWVRTGTSLITFGFAVYKFFELETEVAASQTEALIKTSPIGPREFGLLLIGVGLLTLLLGSFEHGRDLRTLRRDYRGMPSSGTRLVAILVGLLGLLAFVGVLYRF